MFLFQLITHNIINDDNATRNNVVTEIAVSIISVTAAIEKINHSSTISAVVSTIVVALSNPHENYVQLKSQCVT